MALTFTIGGISYLTAVDFRSVRVQDSVEVKGDTMDFEAAIYENSFPEIRAGNEVIFADGATREFAGSILKVTSTQGEGNRLVLYKVECTDYTWLLDRRVLNKVYTSKAADLMMGEVLDDLQTNADSDGDGDAHYNDFQGDKSLLDTDAPVIKQQLFERLLPSQAFDVIAEASGMQWFVDFNKKVNLFFLDANPVTALSIPSGQDRPTFVVDTQILDPNIELVESVEGVATKAILSNTFIRSTNTITDDPIWRTGDDLFLRFRRRPFSELDIVTVKANGVTMTQKLEDIDLNSEDSVPSGQALIFIGPRDKPGTSYVRFAAADIADGQKFEATYNYGFSDDHEGIDLGGSIEDLAERTGGDGIHEFVFSQISGIEVTNQEDLDEITDIILARKATVSITGSFTSITKGWAAGQTFDLIWESRSIGVVEPLQLYVINTRKQILTPADDPNISDNVIQTEVQFSNMPRGVRI